MLRGSLGSSRLHLYKAAQSCHTAFALAYPFFTLLSHPLLRLRMDFLCPLSNQRRNKEKILLKRKKKKKRGLQGGVGFEAAFSASQCLVFPSMCFFWYRTLIPPGRCGVFLHFARSLPFLHFVLRLSRSVEAWGCVACWFVV